MLHGKFQKFNNEYVLASVTALIVILASAISLSILAAAINFSTAPIKNNDVEAKIIQVEPFKAQDKPNKKSSSQKNSNRVKIIKINP